MGFDETWRYRYEVADLYHQRFWNQLLNMIMERPFALNQAQLSMDAGGGSHDPNKAIPLRIRLRNSEGKVPEPPYPDVDALIWAGKEVVATIPLKERKPPMVFLRVRCLGWSPTLMRCRLGLPAFLMKWSFLNKD